MVGDQLLCIVTPCGAAQAVAEPQRAALDAALRRLACVHFASLTLLPPPPGAGAACSLALELVVEDDLPLDELLDRLVGQALEALWPLYVAQWDSRSERSTWLRGFLRRHVHRADGGFVGCRDRSVAQIHQEATLLNAVRARVQSRPADAHTDRRALAAEAAGWVGAQAELAWVQQPSPRSPWRARSMSRPRRFAAMCVRLVLPALAVLFILMALFAVAADLTLLAGQSCCNLPPRLWGALFGPFEPYSQGAAAAVGTVGLLFAVIVVLRSLHTLITAVAAALLMAAGVVLPVMLLLVPLLGGAYAAFFGAVGVLLLCGLGIALGLAAAVAGAALLGLGALLAVPRHLGARAVLVTWLLLLAAAGWGVHALIDTVAAHAAAWGWTAPALLRGRWVGPLPLADALVLLTVVMAVFAAAVWAAAIAYVVAAFTGMAQRLDRSRRITVPGALQTHASVEACEAALVGGPNHMISLTEIRTPRPWHAWVLRRWLGLISAIGHMWFTEGVLGGAQGIHFAHWHVLDGRLLFFSNFDGSFGGYLDDFILGASQGVNLVWRWTCLRPRAAAAPGHPAVLHARRFPPTHLGLFGGCRTEQWFKTYARDSMLPHLYRFSAYRHACRDILLATDLRDALVGERTGAKDDLIMRAAES